jgi:4-amino-4-deoxychorismate mutase
MSETAHVPEALLEFRRQLNGLDEQIMGLLGQRFQVCRTVAHYKRDHAIPMMQPGRVAEVKERCARMAAEHGIDPEFARRLYAAIIDEACRLEDEIIEERRAGQATGHP